MFMVLSIPLDWISLARFIDKESMRYKNSSNCTASIYNQYISKYIKGGEFLFYELEKLWDFSVIMKELSAGYLDNHLLNLGTHHYKEPEN